MTERVAVVAVLALAITSCTSSDIESSITAAAAATTTATTTTTTVPTGTSSPTTSTTAPPTTTTTTSTTTVPDGEPVWVATYRRDFPGYAVELVEINTNERITIAANRHDPFPHAVFGDGDGGIVTGRPFAHLPAASQHPVTIVDTGIDAMAMIDGVPTALYRTWEGESGWDDLIMWDDMTISLIAQPLGGEPTTVLSAHSASRVDYVTGEGDLGEPRPGRSGYGGGVLAVVWTTRTEECSWLELRQGLTAEPAPLVNPWPPATCEDGGFGAIDVAITGDGGVLVAWVSTAGGGSDLVASDLMTGREIDRLTGVLHFGHDGDRRFAVVQQASGTEQHTVLAELTTDGFAVTPLPGISQLIGVITGELRIASNATLATTEPWTTCSTAGRAVPAAQDGLPTPVAATRDAVASAVVECDLIALADLAIVSAEFRMVDAISYCDEPWPMSIQDDDVVHHWYAGDRSGNELSIMLDTLDSPYQIADQRYVWVGPHDYRIEIDADGAWVRNQRGLPPPECEGMECTC